MNDNRIFWKEVDGYCLSVIRRKYDTCEGETSGTESAIMSGPPDNRKLVWIDGTDWSNHFAMMETATDVQAFLKEKEEY